MVFVDHQQVIDSAADQQTLASCRSAQPAPLAGPLLSASPAIMECTSSAASSSASRAPHRPQQQPRRRRQQRRQRLATACTAQPPRVVLYDAYDRLVPYEHVRLVERWWTSACQYWFLPAAAAAVLAQQCRPPACLIRTLIVVPLPNSPPANKAGLETAKRIGGRSVCILFFS